MQPNERETCALRDRAEWVAPGEGAPVHALVAHVLEFGSDGDLLFLSPYLSVAWLTKRRERVTSVVVHGEGHGDHVTVLRCLEALRAVYVAEGTA